MDRVGRWIACIGSAVLIVTGCSMGEDCDDGGGPNLEVKVIDAETGDAICNATVVAERNGVSTTLAGPCPYRGQLQAGRGYDVSASAPGYAGRTRSVYIDPQHCGGEELELGLAKAP